MNRLSIVLVIALVGYSLGAPQIGHYELEEEYEQITPEHRYGSNQRNGNNREYGNIQGQSTGTIGGRIQSHGNSQRQGAGTIGGRIQNHGNSQGQGAGTKGGRIQGHGNNQGQGEYRQPEHGGYHAPEQQYDNNPGYGGRLQQNSQGGRGSNNQGYGFDRY